MLDFTHLIRNTCATTEDIAGWGAICSFSIIIFALLFSFFMNVIGEEKIAKEAKKFVIGERGFIIFIMFLILIIAYVFAPEVANMIAPGKPC